MEQIDSKLDLFQSLKDEESNDHEGTSVKSISESEDHREELKFEPHEPTRNLSDEDQNDDQPGTSYDQDHDSEPKKIKLDKQNRKEVEEEEREKML